jgi:hypothetical protein
VAAQFETKLKAIGRGVPTPHASGGQTREALLAELLRNYLPGGFAIDTGLIASANGMFSKQADLFITDLNWNAPLHPSTPNRIWLIEAVYALFDVKNALLPGELKDAITKCRRFKQIARHWSDTPAAPRLPESLFVIWAFKCAASGTVKKNLVEALHEVPVPEQPDFIVVPGRLVATCGSSRRLNLTGQPGSPCQTALESQIGPELAGSQNDLVQVDECARISLLVWFLSLISWLKAAGPRSSNLMAYLPTERVWGRRV